MNLWNLMTCEFIICTTYQTEEPVLLLHHIAIEKESSSVFFISASEH